MSFKTQEIKLDIYYFWDSNAMKLYVFDGVEDNYTHLSNENPREDLGASIKEKNSHQ